MTERYNQDVKANTTGGISDKSGFTLVELIVVLVILAILAAILVPALLGWIDKAKEKGVILECREVVHASQATATEIYGKKGDVTVFDVRASETKAEILKLADVTGTIQNISINNNHIINYLRYRTADGIVVTYNIDADVRYVIGSSYSADAKGYYDWVDDARVDKNLNYDLKGTQELQKVFKEENGGEFPGLTEWEAQLIDAPSDNNLEWRPYMADGTVLLGAAAPSSNLNVNLLFYNGNYYYHENGYGKKDGASITDKGNFDVSVLDAAPSSKEYQKDGKSTWIRYVP